MIDISVLLRPGTPEWPGDTPYSCRWTAEIARGSSVNLSSISGSPHVGTHADAPLHVHDGWAASDALPLDVFVGPAIVVDVSHIVRPTVELPDLDESLGSAPLVRLLLRTGRTIADGPFPPAWPVLSLPCVRALLGRGLRLLGVDAPSVDPRADEALPVHRALFSGGAYVLENLDLRAAAPGTYELLAAPLRLAGLDAAPVRAVLRDRPTP